MKRLPPWLWASVALCVAFLCSYNLADGFAEDTDFGLSFTAARFAWAAILTVVGIGIFWAIDAVRDWFRRSEREA